MKITEKEISDLISNYMSEYPTKGSKHQWAYKKKYSTELLLVHMTETWRKHVDRKKVVIAVFIDFKKAFDTVPRQILLEKSQRLGITGEMLAWIQDYLAERYQYTSTGSVNLPTERVEYGVSQGFLGPLLFALFCNDVPACASEGDGTID